MIDKQSVLVCLPILALLVLVLAPHQTRSDSTTKNFGFGLERFLQRRQAATSESEQESTTAKNQGQPQSQQPSETSNNGANHQQQPGRLYPDLARMPYALPPPLPYNPHYPPNHGPTPFVPFGLQMPTNRLNDGLQFNRLPPRPVQSASDRLQSQAFTNNLGRRLLSMIGLSDPPSSNETSSTTTTTVQGEGDTTTGGPRSPSFDEIAMRAMQNSTVLHQLNRGIQSIYGGLSKMYNSTVQQQLNLLQESFKRETENNTNPWQQRMAQQVPMFFKSMVTKVEEVQSNLNRIISQVTQANQNGSFVKMPPAPQTTQRGSTLGPFDQFMRSPNEVPGGGGPFSQPGNFFNQIGRSFGFGPEEPSDSQNYKDNIGQKLMEFWHTQVQPQIGMVRNQMARVWRDLTASGVYQMDPMMVRSRNNGNNLGSPSAKNENASSDIVDDILKSVDMNSPEYSIIEPKSDQQQPASNERVNSMGSQIQNRLITMQRDLNQLWNGLSSSIQGALSNVRNSLNPGQQFGAPLDTSATNKQEVDPAQNEIDGKIKDLSKLQRDADVVYDAVQKQQQAQQRPTFGDRFRNFIGNVDLGNVDQLPNRIGESVTRFGSAVGDLWSQIPNRWDNFMQNVRPQQQPHQQNPSNGRLTVASSGSTTQKPIEAVSNFAS